MVSNNLRKLLVNPLSRNQSDFNKINLCDF